MTSAAQFLERSITSMGTEPENHLDWIILMTPLGEIVQQAPAPTAAELAAEARERRQQLAGRLFESHPTFMAEDLGGDPYNRAVRATRR
jgi:hypothetical protein